MGPLSFEKFLLERTQNTISRTADHCRRSAEKMTAFLAEQDEDKPDPQEIEMRRLQLRQIEDEFDSKPSVRTTIEELLLEHSKTPSPRR